MKTISIVLMLLSVLLCSKLKMKINKYFGKINKLGNSWWGYILDGLKLLIIISMIVVPILHYKGLIDVNQILDDLMRNPYFLSSNTYEVTTFIYIVYYQLLYKLVNRYIKFEIEFSNFEINL